MLFCLSLPSNVLFIQEYNDKENSVTDEHQDFHEVLENVASHERLRYAGGSIASTFPLDLGE